MRPHAVPILLAVAVAAFLPVSSVAVEGGGTYRGETVILPYFERGPGVRTFYRFVTAHDRQETGAGGGSLRLSFVERDGRDCITRTTSFPMTKNDYLLLDVSGVLPGPGGPRKGYAVADFAPADATGSANHLMADLLVIDVVEGTAWGANASAIRAEETIRYPQQFFVPFLSRADGRSGASFSDTRLVVVPPAWQDRTQWTWDARVFDRDEMLQSVSGGTVTCFADRPLRDWTSGATDNPFRFPGGQGFLEISGQGAADRALVVQIEAITLDGAATSWALWPAHDRTTAEIDPDPTVPSQEPDGVPVYP